jgi:DNA-binding transcriptional MerR regulator
MQIGMVAQSTGLSVDTIRFYEKQSLIPLAQRTDAGYRVYDESTVDRLQLIGRAQSLGFSLREIRELLLIEDGEPDGCSHVRDLIADKVSQVKEKIAAAGMLNPLLATSIQVASELIFILNSTRVIPPKEKSKVANQEQVPVHV